MPEAWELVGDLYLEMKRERDAALERVRELERKLDEAYETVNRLVREVRPNA